MSVHLNGVSCSAAKPDVKARVKDVGRTDYGELFRLPVRPRSRRTSVFIQGS